MNILLQMPGRAVDEWHAALATALPDAAIAMWPDAPPAPDYALVWKPPAELFKRSRPTRAIFNLGAGVDSLLAVPTLPEGVPVIRLEDAGMAAQMAEYVTLAVLRAYRESDRYDEAQRAGRWQPRPRLAQSDFGIGILGFGVLGRAVAAALAPFGFPLAGWSRRRRDEAGVAAFAGPDELPAFLQRTRVLVCLLPSTLQTRGLLCRATLERLSRGAHVVNVARGDLVVDADLVALLDAGHLAGATLDVFRTEPLPPDHAFWHHPRIVVTPHVSAVTDVASSISQVAVKIRRLQQGQPVTGVVDRGRGY
ncbi:MAG: glyoxylate/hydroxypyruvate reductase A [Betaproteobacteria bacterium]